MSSLLVVTEVQLAGADEARPGSLLRELVDTFIDTDLAETTAVLTAIRALTTDESLRATIQPVLAARRQPMPAWLSSLDGLAVGPVRLLTDILGDGDDYLLEARLPSGDRFTALVYVDHNMGTVVNDAFVSPTTLDELTALITAHTEPGQELREFDSATARAVVTDAIERGDQLDPPLQTETWPGCRPLVEWLLRRLPPGGRVPVVSEWSDEKLDGLVDEFFSSPYGKPIAGVSARWLVALFVRLGAASTPLTRCGGARSTSSCCSPSGFRME